MNLTKFWWGLGFVLVTFAVVVCLLPARDVGVFGEHDKLSHLAGHGSMAAYFAGLVPMRRWWKIFVFLLLLGVAIELAQYWMNVGREADARDVLANSIGAALGLLLARLGLARWPEFVEQLLRREESRS